MSFPTARAVHRADENSGRRPVRRSARVIRREECHRGGRAVDKRLSDLFGASKGRIVDAAP